MGALCDWAGGGQAGSSRNWRGGRLCDFGWQAGGDWRVGWYWCGGIIHNRRAWQAGWQRRSRWADTIDAAWQASVNGSVSALALHQGILYIGGSFSTVNGFTQHNLSAVSAATGGAIVWGLGADNVIYALQVVGDSLYIGGWFSNIGGVARVGFAQANLATQAIVGPDLSISHQTYGMIAAVNTMAVAHGHLYLGGSFDAIGGQPRTDLAAIRLSDGTLDPWTSTVSVVQSDAEAAGPTPQFGAPPPPSDPNNVMRLIATDQQIYLVQQEQSIYRYRALSISHETGARSGIEFLLDGSVYALAYSNAILYPGGTFQQANGEAHVNAVATRYHHRSVCWLEPTASCERVCHRPKRYGDSGWWRFCNCQYDQGDESGGHEPGEWATDTNHGARAP